MDLSRGIFCPGILAVNNAVAPSPDKSDVALTYTVATIKRANYSNMAKIRYWILLAFLVVPSCSAFSTPQPLCPTSSVSRFTGKAAVNSRLELIQGGDDTKYHREGNSDINNSLNQLQWSGLVGAPILKAVIGSFWAFLNIILREIKTLTFHQKVFFATTFGFGFYMGRLRPFWKRLTDVNEIPNSLFGPGAPSLPGRVVSVSDGDTIRFLHKPTIFHPDALRKVKGEKASATALPIRLCTIDTPETKKFGKPGQPFGEEAKEYLKSLLENKTVRIRLLQKDQYGRAVAEVFTSKVPRPLASVLPMLRNYMDAQMLKKGLAEVYLGGGAVYGPLGKDEYLALQEKAKTSRKGIWSLKKRESPAEYKKRTK